MASSMNKSISDAPNKDEETYQLLEQLDHILKRPETYIGSNKPCHEVRLLCLRTFSTIITHRKCGFLMKKPKKVRKLSKKKSPMCPVSTKFLMKFSVKIICTIQTIVYICFISHLVNAADNKQRDSTMTSIEVDINQ
jgi:hypothetical protein